MSLERCELNPYNPKAKEARAQQRASFRVQSVSRAISCADGTLRPPGANPFAGAYQVAADALRVPTAEVVACHSREHAEAVMDGHAGGRITRVAVSPVPPAIRELENRAHDPVERIRRERRDQVRWTADELTNV